MTNRGSALLGAALLSLQLVVGCATREQVDSARNWDYGPPPQASVWQPKMMDHFAGLLKDPDSAQYMIGCPVRAFMKNALLTGGNGIQFIGFIARVSINAKNSYGAYAGYKNYLVLLSSAGDVDRVIEEISGMPHPLIEFVETQPCERPTRVNRAP